MGTCGGDWHDLSRSTAWARRGTVTSWSCSSTSAFPVEHGATEDGLRASWCMTMTV